MDSQLDSQWKHDRRLTRDLLLSLEANDLLFSPGPDVGALWKHFRHLGRVQENFMHALITGNVEFGFEGATYQGGASGPDLIDYLDRLDAGLVGMLMTPEKICPDISWPGERISVREHLSRLAEHEILHHGMFIVILKLLGRKFPKSWQAWGV